MFEWRVNLRHSGIRVTRNTKPNNYKLEILHVSHTVTTLKWCLCLDQGLTYEGKRGQLPEAQLLVM